MESASHHETSRIVPHHRVHVRHELSPVSVPGQEHSSGPQVILVRDGDTVTAIEVICECGKRIRLNCTF